MQFKARNLELAQSFGGNQNSKFGRGVYLCPHSVWTERLYSLRKSTWNFFGNPQAVQALHKAQTHGVWLGETRLPVRLLQVGLGRSLPAVSLLHGLTAVGVGRLAGFRRSSQGWQHSGLDAATARVCTKDLQQPTGAALSFGTPSNVQWKKNLLYCLSLEKLHPKFLLLTLGNRHANISPFFLFVFLTE